AGGAAGGHSGAVGAFLRSGERASPPPPANALAGGRAGAPSHNLARKRAAAQPRGGGGGDPGRRGRGRGGGGWPPFSRSWRPRRTSAHFPGGDTPLPGANSPRGPRGDRLERRRYGAAARSGSVARLRVDPGVRVGAAEVAPVTH